MKRIILLSASELFLPGQTLPEREWRVSKGAAGQERVTSEHPSFVCARTLPPIPFHPSPSPPPSPLPPPSHPDPHLSDPGRSSFWNISLERITKVFSLALLSCDQSIAQEMGSLESCLSKISYFTSWSILREHSAPSLPRANISVTCVLGARQRPHILSAVKENTAPLLEHSLCAPLLPQPPAQLGGQRKS